MGLWAGTLQPRTLALGNYCLLPVRVWICPFWTFHTDGVIHVVFCDRPLSLGTVSRCIRVAGHSNT